MILRVIDGTWKIFQTLSTVHLKRMVAGKMLQFIHSRCFDYRERERPTLKLGPCDVEHGSNSYLEKLKYF